MNPYETLNLDRDATDNEIKKAYRALSKDCHPDIHGEEARPLFENLIKARDILLDPDRRSEFDEFGTLSESKIEKEKRDKDRAIGTIIELVNAFASHIAANGFHGEDLKLSVITSIRKNIDVGKGHVEKQNLGIKRLSNFITRLRSKEGILKVVIASQKNNLKGIVEERNRNRETLRAMNKALELMNDLDFDADMEEFMQIEGSTTVMFTIRG